MQREDFILARDKAYINLEKLKIKYEETKEIDLDTYELVVREYHLRMSALRMFDIFKRESDASVGRWTSASYIKYYECAIMLHELANLGDTLYDIQNSNLTSEYKAV